MLQDILDFAFLGAVIYAWGAPVSLTVRLYLQIQFIAVTLYLWLKLFPVTGAQSSTYAGIYWTCFTAALLSMASIIYVEGWRMIRCRTMRFLTAGWCLLALWYVGYFLNPKSDSLDWCPDVILGTTFFILGYRARAGNQRRTSGPLEVS